jgi:hypothetical protein
MRDIDHRVIVAASPAGDKEGRIRPTAARHSPAPPHETESERPGTFVGETESASWLGGAPSARVVDPETDQAEVVPFSRITPRDE